MKYVKTFENFNQNDTSIEKGDLVFCKNIGQSGLVGLVVSDVYENDDCMCVDVYFRGFSGDIFPVTLDEITIINSENIYILDEKSDFDMYKSIAKKKDLKFNIEKYAELVSLYRNDE